jgi:hypothetical protein
LKNVIELGLRAPHAISVPAALRLAVDKLLTVLQQVVGTIDYADCEELAERVEACRRAVGAANDAASIVALTEQCCAACQRILAETEPQRLSQTREIAALVGLVREALRAVASDNTEFSAKLGDAMHRFEDVVQLKDISQVKAQLVKEIGLFRDVVEERHKAWESATENFGRRVEALERQLTATRLEAAIDPLSRIANRGTFDRTCQEWRSRTSII